MGRISLYVPDDLKKRMSAVDDDSINWSEVVRPAIHAALAKFEHRKGQTMQTVIERLRASREESRQRHWDEGVEGGRQWARDHATFDELTRLAAAWEQMPPGSNDQDYVNVFYRSVGHDREMTLHELRDHCFGDERALVSDAYVAGFFEGAVDVFDDVKDEL
jgi:hypothetical protein